MPKSKPPRTRRPNLRRLNNIRQLMLDATTEALRLNEAVLHKVDSLARQVPGEKKLAELRAELEHHRRELLESRADAFGLGEADKDRRQGKPRDRSAPFRTTP